MALVVERSHGPNLFVRFVWWLLISWWASGIVVPVAWLALNWTRHQIGRRTYQVGWGKFHTSTDQTAVWKLRGWVWAVMAEVLPD